ncbi:MAG: hypothetical protein ACQETL_09925 [Bacteroidota bacterium]
MKKRIAISFSILILALPMVKMAILIQFGFNRDYIIENLCVERDKTINTCQGQCLLSQKLNEASNEEQESFLVEIIEQLFLINNKYFGIKSNHIIGYISKTPVNNMFIIKIFESQIFHPPIF